MKARELALRHGMRNYDAIHLAHAITAGADVLMTVDQGFPLDSAVEGVWSTLRELVGRAARRLVTGPARHPPGISCAP